MIKFVGIILLKFLIIFTILAIVIHISLWVSNKFLVTDHESKHDSLPKLRETLQGILNQKVSNQDLINEQNYNYAKYVEWDALDRKCVLEPLTKIQSGFDTNIRDYREGLINPHLEIIHEQIFQGQAPVIPEAFMPITETTGVFPAGDMPYNDDSSPFLELATNRIAQLQALDHPNEFDEYDKAHLEYSNNMEYRREKLETHKKLAKSNTLDLTERNIITEKYEQPLSYGPYF
jgi:hypothetical protein